MQGFPISSATSRALVGACRDQVQTAPLWLQVMYDGHDKAS